MGCVIVAIITVINYTKLSNYLQGQAAFKKEQNNNKKTQVK